MKVAIAGGLALLLAPVAFIMFFVAPMGQMRNCAENSIPSPVEYELTQEQRDNALTLFEAAPTELNAAQAGLILVLAAMETELRESPKTTNPFTGTALGSASLSEEISKQLRRADMVSDWQNQPVTATAAQITRTWGATAEEAWPLAYAVMMELDEGAAVLLDSLERTDDACGTALNVVWELDEPVIIDGFTHPLPGAVRTSSFGYRIHPISGVRRLHAGVDYALPGDSCGAPIRAMGAGEVSYAGAWDGYGNVVIIEHDNGLTTRYAHMETNGILTRAGLRVEAGDVIAVVGTAGTSTACHLHLEVYLPNGAVANPDAVFPWLKPLGSAAAFASHTSCCCGCGADGAAHVLALAA